MKNTLKQKIGVWQNYTMVLIENTRLFKILTENPDPKMVSHSYYNEGTFPGLNSEL